MGTPIDGGETLPVPQIGREGSPSQYLSVVLATLLLMATTTEGGGTLLVPEIDTVESLS